jgi:phage terminase Nu1 subunit (DNA packaging protein)
MEVRLTKNTQYVSQVKMAEILGISKQMVNKYVKSGQFKLVNSKVDKMQAIAAYAEIKKTTSSSDDSATSAVNNSNINNQYQKAKAAEKIYKAQLAELAVKEKKSKLIPIENVVDEVQKIAEIIRSELISLPNKLSGQLDNLPAAEVQVILRKTVNEILTSCYELSMKYDESILADEKSHK